jgi:hypothetical protein
MRSICGFAAGGLALFAQMCSGNEIVLCGRVIPPSYPSTNAMFHLFSAVVDSNRVSRIVNVANASKFKLTFEYGFITSAGHVLDLFVFDTQGRRVTMEYCVTRDHISAYGPQPPWGTPSADDPHCLITNRADMIAILQEVSQEFDAEYPWTRMALPICVDISTATNRTVRRKRGNELRDDIEWLRTAVTGRR